MKTGLGHGVVAELMKMQTLYEGVGLEIRVEDLASMDGLRVGLLMPGKEVAWKAVPAAMERSMEYSAIQDVLDWVEDYVAGRLGDDGTDLLEGGLR